MPQSSKVLKKIQAAALDQRVANVRYRQKEIHRLYSKLFDSGASIRDLIVRDSQCSAAEAMWEYALTMESMKALYDEMNLDSALEEEYQVGKQKDNANRRVNVGLVLIRPTKHTRFYSMMHPMTVAIAAGNCVIIERLSPASELDEHLKSIIQSSLDNDVFEVVDSKIELQSGGASVFVLDQNESSDVPAHGLASQPQRLALAVVDRTADLNQAAKDIVQTRWLFNGRSPYAPDLVMVNEFVKDDFLDAMLRNIDTLASRRSHDDRERPEPIISACASEEYVLLGPSHFQVADIRSRSSPLLQTKSHGPFLSVLSTRSHTDIATIQNQLPGSPLAGYYFGQPAIMKFLSHEISAHVSFKNYIPLSLLVGPALPPSQPYSSKGRYTPEMMTVPRSEFGKPPSEKHKVVARALEECDSEPLASLVRSIKPVNQPSGSGLGFFDQGIITGLVLFVFPVVVIVSYGAFVGASYMLNVARTY